MQKIRLAGISMAALVMAGGPSLAETWECPVTGGDLVFGQEAKVNSLDMHASSTISTRNVAMHIYESLMTRDETNNPILELAEAVDTSEDGLTYTFTLRDGITFHDGSDMTSADVAASFDRYKEIGVERGILSNVDSWETPDDLTFVVHMKTAQPTFLEDLSSFSVPIVIVPEENAGADPLKLEAVGTGPFELVEFIADSHVELKRFEDYQPNEAYDERTGFGGYKVACLDTVTFRIVTEPGSRVAGLETGELDAVEDVPQASVDRLAANEDIEIVPYENFWIHLATPNFEKAPTDDPLVRRAIATALDMDEIMLVATDGAYNTNFGFQTQDRKVFSDAGEEYFNIADPEKAKALLEEAGYDGEELVLLTNRDYSTMYNAALVMSEQLQDIGMNVRVEVQDWPATIATRNNSPDAWNYHFTGWGTNTSLGYLAVFKFIAPPAPIYALSDPEANMDEAFNEAYARMMNGATFEERAEAFADAQEIVMQNGLALPFGWLTKNQAVRSNVHNFVPFRIPRMYNVWMEPEA